jgi:hypothetical protein
MTEIEAFVLPTLNVIQADIALIKRDITDSKLRLTAIEQHAAASITSETRQNNRLDELDDRIQRIERRLELTS